jgi:hypothetical protein
MPEFDDTLGDRSLRDAFESLRAGSMDAVIPEGPDAVRHTVRRRHRNRVAAVAVFAVLVVLAGGATAMAGLNPAGHVVQPANSDSAKPTPSGSASPSGRPKPSSSESGGAAPDGRIGRNQLMNATIDVPDWGVSGGNPCAAGSGRLTFHDGVVDLGDGARVLLPGNGDITLPPVYFQDVDHDGADETVVVLWCGVQGGYYQAVALDRNGDGDLITLGQIASTASANRPLAEIDQVAFTSDTDIQLHWIGRTGSSDSTGVGQWRTYSWTGSGFDQVDGPTAFPSPSSGTIKLSVAAPNVTMTSNGDGTYVGTLSITVTNSGDVPLTEFHLTFKVPQGAVFNTATSGTSGYTCSIFIPTQGRCDYSGSLPPNGLAKTTATVQTRSGTIPTDKSDANVYYTTDNPSAADSWFLLVAG